MPTPVEVPLPPPKPTLWSRFRERLPILESVIGAMVIDAIDITDIPLVSWWYGIPAALLLGYWVASLFKFPAATRVVLAIMAAVYFVLPGTGALPLATIVVTAARIAGVGQIGSRLLGRPKLGRSARG